MNTVNPALSYPLGALCLALAACSAAPSDQELQASDIGTVQSPIINGQDASPGEWPWQIALLRDRGGEDTFTCGGVLLNDSWVLTAAHCVSGVFSPLPAEDLTVVAGDYILSSTFGTEQPRAVAEVILHPHYGLATRAPDNSIIEGDKLHDIALLRLESPVQFNDFVQPIALSDDYLEPGTEVFITGWGRLDPNDSEPSDVLQELRTEVVDLAECKSVMDAVVQEQAPDSDLEVLASNICIGSINPRNGSCGGDSGGPLVTQEADGSWSLVGVTSWGSTTCDAYTAYTHVRPHKRWIQRTMPGAAPICSGRTINGNSGWSTYSSGNGVYMDIDTSPCDADNDSPIDFQILGNTMYFTSIGGDTGLWTTRGANSIYSTSETGFRSYIYQSGLTASTAESRRYHINWEAIRPNIHGPTICTGNTPKGATNWKQLSSGNIYVDIDMTDCDFDEVPVVIPSLAGRTQHWTATGASAVYNLTSSGFRIYIQKSGITPSTANSKDWQINWQALVENTNSVDFCAGRTTPGATQWEQISNGIRTHVDTSFCGEDHTPLYLMSIGGDRNHRGPLGSNAIYSPTPDGFTVTLRTSKTAAYASQYNWHVNWKMMRSRN